MVKYLGANIATLSSRSGHLSSQVDTLPTNYESKPIIIPSTSTPSSSSDPAVDPLEPPQKVVYTRQPLPQLDREDYPGVRQWFPTAYNDLHRVGKGSGEDGPLVNGPKPSVLSSFMEDEDGHLIPTSTKASMRALAKRFFWQILRNGRAPARWGDVSLDVSNELIYLLESNYEWLRYCQDHWKARKVATNSYLQWYIEALPRYNKEKAKAKAAQGASSQPLDTEVIDVNADSNTQKRPLKRRLAEEDGAGRPKRPHLEEAPPSTQPARPTASRRRVC